jgi:hypothetical protein
MNKVPVEDPASERNEKVEHKTRGLFPGIFIYVSGSIVLRVRFVSTIRAEIEFSLAKK